MAGLLKKDYHAKRKEKKDFIYRMEKRADEVAAAIETYMRRSPKNNKFWGKKKCLEVGTADGLLLSRLNRKFGFKQAIGVDMSKELLETNKDKSLKLFFGNAEKLKFSDGNFDIVVAAAVIEHVDHPENMLSECKRVLRKGGIIVITTPNPFHDWVASKIGYLKGDTHLETMSMGRLDFLLKKAGFNVLTRKYFMLFPLRKIPFEGSIESLLNMVRVGKIMTNQLIVGRK